MCGIFGSINFKEFDRHKIETSLIHRGPDDLNWKEYSNILFFHSRLAIQDLSDSGKQPMEYLNYSIVFNGEIYNHFDLRKKYDLKCFSNSDTETLLHLYSKFKEEMLNMLDGMFAFAIFDKLTKKLFIARDRAGEKPLYFFKNSTRSFVFSSELNALKSILNFGIDNEAVGSYLRLGYVHKTSTPYTNVYELEAGSYILIDTISLEFNLKKWWNIQDKYINPCNHTYEEAKVHIEKMLIDSIKLRISSSDLEVGSFLSGGIDSGLVTAIASNYTKDLKTFTVSFEGAYNEAPFAKLVARKYNTNHTEISIGFENLKNDIETILNSYGEPFSDSSVIPSYYVSREAKKSVTVVLNGDGGDELFAGYRRHVLYNKIDPWKTSTLMKSILYEFQKILPNSNNKSSYFNFFSRLVFLNSRKKIEDIYISSTSDIFEGYTKYLKQGLNRDISRLENELNDLMKLPFSSLQKLMIADFNNLLSGDLLVKMDIATMQFALEGRSPFLSKDLLDYVPSIRDSYKIQGKTSKFVLRDLANKYLPTNLINLPKRGFEVPLKKWVDSELREPIGDYLFDNRAIHLNFVESTFVENLFNKKINIGEEKRAKILWNLFCLDVWYKKNF